MEPQNSGIPMPVDSNTSLPINENEVVRPTFSPPKNPNAPRIQFGPINPVEMILAAEYFSQRGDTRLKDIIDKKVEKYVSDPNFSLDYLIQISSFDPDEIFDIAERELDTQNSINNKIQKMIQNR
jgi:hypothetical protein